MQIERFYRLSDPNLRPRVCRSTSLKTRAPWTKQTMKGCLLTSCCKKYQNISVFNVYNKHFCIRRVSRHACVATFLRCENNIGKYRNFIKIIATLKNIGKYRNARRPANLLGAQANSVSYPRRNWKWLVATDTGWRPSVADWGDGVSASCTVGPIVH